MTNFKIDVGTGEIVGNNSRSHGGPHTRSRMNPWRVLTSGTKVLYTYIYLVARYDEIKREPVPGMPPSTFKNLLHGSCGTSSAASLR